MSSELIRSHKKVNDSVVVLGSEAVAIAFYKLTKIYNEQMEYKDLELTKQSLWEISGYSGKYNSVKLKSLIKELTNSKTFDISALGIKNIESISGSMFVITVYTDGKITVEVPLAYRQLLFYKRDINLMHKAKCIEKMSVEDLDYYDREVKNKSKFLVLLNEADLLNIKGKYNKRIYALLKQWDNINKYEKNWSEFKEILEVPKSYRATHIDKEILSKVKKELLKANIKITKIEKVKKGRNIDKIRILFKAEKAHNVYDKEVQAKEIESSYKANEDVKISREDVIKQMMIKKTDIVNINRTLKVLKYKETTLDECAVINEKITLEMERIKMNRKRFN